MDWRSHRKCCAGNVRNQSAQCHAKQPGCSVLLNGRNCSPSRCSSARSRRTTSGPHGRHRNSCGATWSPGSDRHRHGLHDTWHLACSPPRLVPAAEAGCSKRAGGRHACSDTRSAFGARHRELPSRHLCGGCKHGRHHEYTTQEITAGLAISRQYKDVEGSYGRADPKAANPVVETHFSVLMA